MFTVFVNTDKELQVERHAPLIDNLRGAEELLFFKCALDELSSCAEELAGRISWDDDLGEEYNLIVYAAAEDRNEAALASEHIISLQIEENLFTKLYDLGKKPKKAVILFGENFNRGKEYGAGLEYELNVRQRFWDMFPVPALEETRKLLRITQELCGDQDDDVFAKAFVDAMKKHQTGHSGLPEDSEFVDGTLTEMAESVRKDESENVDLLSELYNAVENQREYVRKDVTGYQDLAYIRLKDSDVNAISRSVYQILLFVCLAAATGDIPLVDPENKVDEKLSPAKKTIPSIDWEKTAGELEAGMRRLEREKRQLSNWETKFPMFNKELTDGTKLTLGVNKPKLQLTASIQRGISIARLQVAAQVMIREIRRKTQENDARIVEYTTKLTDQFNKDKDKLMGSMRYKSEAVDIRNDNLTAQFIQREQEHADVKIARKRRLSPAAINIEDLLKLAERRIAYCFSCLDCKKMLAGALLALVLFFAVPYLALNRELWEISLGPLYFGTLLVVTVLAFGVGCAFFFLCYRLRIVKELRSLSTKFTEIQREKDEAVLDYAELIEHDIPLSYLLELYRMEFEQYLRRTKAIGMYVTYHTKQLNRFLSYIASTLSELGIAESAPSEDPGDGEQQSRLVLEWDYQKNNEVYFVIRKDRFSDCFGGMTGGEAK